MKNIRYKNDKIEKHKEVIVNDVYCILKDDLNGESDS